MARGSLSEATDVDGFNPRFKLQIGEASQNLLHRHAQFHASEMNTKTHMRAASEGKVALRFAVDIEDVGVFPTLRIAVGDTDHKIYKGSGGNSNAFDFRIGNSCAAE